MTSADRIGKPLIAAGSLIGLVICLFNFFNEDSGIAGSGGALLVIVSSALILGAIVVLWLARPGAGLRVPLEVLLLLGIIGTGLAAYMLEAPLLLAAMALALIGWLVDLFAGGAARTARVAGAAP